MKALSVVVALVVLRSATGPAVTVGPTISGSLQQGRQLTVSTGTWSESGTVSYAYQWYRCDGSGAHCSSIHGATRATYVAVAKDVGGTVAAAVAATDTTGTTRAFTPLAGLIAAKSATLLAAAQPSTSGTATVGQLVTVAPVKWSHSGTTSTFAWQRCNANGRLCAPIDGAVSATYPVAQADVGARLVAAVTGSSGGATATVLSLPTAAVTAASGPIATGRPSVAGTLQQGQRLIARPGTWLGDGAVTYAFQWYRCDANAAHCHSIHGATKPTYVEVAKDAGQTIGLAVRATDGSGTTTAYAPVAGTIAAAGALAATRQPALSGKPAVGEKLVVKAGTWSSRPGALTYTWLRCNPNGRACAEIAGATGSSYTVTAADRGGTVAAVVHAAAGTAVLTAASLPIT